MKTSDFYYDLPQELIAQTPLQRRDGSRLMTLERNSGAIGHHYFYELPDFLRKGDCLVLNNSRVLPARLIGRRETGGAAEILLLTDRGDNVWECLVRPGKKLRAGARVIFGSGQLEAQIQEVLPDGNRLVRFQYEGIFLEILEQLGKMPLPPYIKEELSDGERYQTVYSKWWGRQRRLLQACISHRNCWKQCRKKGFSWPMLPFMWDWGPSVRSKRKSWKPMTCTRSTA